MATIDDALPVRWLRAFRVWLFLLLLALMLGVLGLLRAFRRRGAGGSWRGMRATDMGFAEPAPPGPGQARRRDLAG
ncbi:MAG: hypothetical protein HY704_10370 [Gemmatimonadetes bacterium]|nr:hypothetical protein [Gemmatimonadota bacterium]